MRKNGNFIEVDFFQKNKAGNVVCGDCFMSQKLKGEGRVISVLSDGLGSGIKACVLSTMTASMAMNFTAMNESILRTSTSIMNTLPKDMVRKISYSTFCICDIDCFGNVKIIEYETLKIRFCGSPSSRWKKKIELSSSVTGLANPAWERLKCPLAGKTGQKNILQT